MKKGLTIKKTVELDANTSRVWEALTNPELTRKYMFGCEIVSDWKPGSPIVWKGHSEGKDTIYVKGNLVNVVPKKLLQFTSCAAGQEELPSNHTTVTYELSPKNGRTVLSVTQGDFRNLNDGEKKYNESNGAWEFALSGLKKLLEERTD